LSPDNTRVYLTGSSGFIGSNIFKSQLGVEIIKVKRSVNFIDLEKNKKNILIWAGEPSHVHDVNNSDYKEQEEITKRLSNFLNLSFDQVIYFSSIYVYKRNLSRKIYKEQDSVDRFNFYSKGKLDREKLVLKRKEGCVFRLSNIYGSGMKNNIFEDIKNEIILDKETLRIRNLKSQLDLIYIDDLLECINKSMEIGIAGLYNLTSKKETTPLTILTTVFKHLGIDKKIVETQPDVFGYLVGDNTKLLSVLDWFPSYSLDEGINKLIKKGYFCG
tara:strand:- start:486 stop:1304 length:819 start_codon:yes stop_codon:yes gene_type:complete